jgi:hypothetical protein
MARKTIDSSTKSIAELAYKLWDARGCHGSAEQDWIEAERLAAISVAKSPSHSDKTKKRWFIVFPEG